VEKQTWLTPHRTALLRLVGALVSDAYVFATLRRRHGRSLFWAIGASCSPAAQPRLLPFSQRVGSVL